MHPNNIVIINFEPHLSQHVKTLNYEWLSKYFVVESTDEEALGNPQKYIIDKGGYIYFVTLNNEIVGTASLLKVTDTEFELGKMAITNAVQGLGLGKILLKHCIEEAALKNAKSVTLYSNTILENAIHLYRKYGFKEVPLLASNYKRSNIKMELKLH